VGGSVTGMIDRELIVPENDEFASVRPPRDRFPMLPRITMKQKSIT
jgi:hypothetical protein